MNIAVIFAGGSGQRMKTRDIPKQFLEIHGKPIIIYTLEHFEKHEQIDAISTTEKVWVAYPIYGQQINTASGLCLHGGEAWRVVWLYGGMSAEKLVTDDTLNDSVVYMNAGVLELSPVSAYHYMPSNAVVGYEWPYAIKTDGSIDRTKPWYYVRKQKEDFLLYDRNGNEQSGRLTGLPNWFYVDSRKRMVRSSNYFYYYNPIEVNNLY